MQSPDGKRVVIEYKDRKAKVFNSKTGIQLCALEDISNCHFSNDGSKLLALGKRGIAKVLNSENGVELIAIGSESKNSGVFDPALSNDGKYVLACCGDSSAKLWDIASGVVTVTVKIPDSFVLSATFSPDGSQIATSHQYHGVKVWDAKSGGLLMSIAKEGGMPKYSLDGSRITTFNESGSTEQWDAKTGTKLESDRERLRNWKMLAISKDGSRIVCKNYHDFSAKVFQFKSGSEVILKGHTDNITSAAFSSNGDQVLTSSNDKTARIWDVNSGEEIAAFQGHLKAVNSARYSSDGSEIVTSSDDETVKMWSNTRIDNRDLEGHKHGVVCASFSNNGNQVVSCGLGLESLIRVQSAKIDAKTIAWEVHKTGFLHSASFSPDDSKIVIGSGGSPSVLDAVTGTDALEFKGGMFASQPGVFDQGDPIKAGYEIYKTNVSSASFSPDGSKIVTAGHDGLVCVWNSNSGIRSVTIRAHNPIVTHASFSRDGLRLVTIGADNRMKVWNALSGDQIVSISLTAVSGEFSPDGKCIVASGLRDTAAIYNSETGQLVFNLVGHTSTVTSSSYSADGLRLVTCSTDGEIKIWNARTGTLLLTLRAHSKGVTSARCSPDGSSILTCSIDESVKIWDARPVSREFLPKQSLPNK